MSEDSLSELLERSADRHSVGSPPLDQMISRSRRARKRRAGLMTLAASVVVGSLVAGTTWLFNPGDSPNPAPNILVPFNEPISLEGEWKVKALTGPDGRSLLLEGQTPTLRFLATNRMTGIEGCNGVAAEYNRSGANDLVFSNIRRISEGRARNAFCADPPLVELLADVRHLSNDNGKLQLHDENWMIIAVLERVSSTPDQEEFVTAASSETLESSVELGRSFVAFAMNPTYASLSASGLDERVDLTLGQSGELSKVFNGSLGPSAWTFELARPFRSATGTFNALITIRNYLEENPKAKLVVSDGAHPRCVGPDLDEFARSFRQISLQPDPTIASCLDWFAVDLFVGDQGRIEIVDLDFFEP